MCSFRPPTASEFRARFTEALQKCRPSDASKQVCAWENWTAFMTGKEGKGAGYWKGDAVIPEVAKSLGLTPKYERLHLDIVFEPQGVFHHHAVIVEHENTIGGFIDEILKLMSVLAPLKVGITYDWKNSGRDARLSDLIKQQFRGRPRWTLEAPEVEYLFLLGTGDSFDRLTWKYLSFTSGNYPEGTHFREIQRSASVASRK